MDPVGQRHPRRLARLSQGGCFPSILTTATKATTVSISIIVILKLLSGARPPTAALAAPMRLGGAVGSAVTRCRAQNVVGGAVDAVEKASQVPPPPPAPNPHHNHHHKSLGAWPPPPQSIRPSLWLHVAEVSSRAGRARQHGVQLGGMNGSGERSRSGVLWGLLGGFFFFWGGGGLMGGLGGFVEWFFWGCAGGS